MAKPVSIHNAMSNHEDVPLILLVAAGCIAGAIETTLTWPMEFIKTQLQLQHPPIKKVSSLNQRDGTIYVMEEEEEEVRYPPPYTHMIPGSTCHTENKPCSSSLPHSKFLFCCYVSIVVRVTRKPNLVVLLCPIQNFASMSLLFIKLFIRSAPMDSWLCTTDWRLHFLDRSPKLGSDLASMLGSASCCMITRGTCRLACISSQVSLPVSSKLSSLWRRWRRSKQNA